MSSGSAAPENRDSQIAELASLTGLAPAEAEQYLVAANGDLSTAASLFFDGSGPSGLQQEQPEDEDDDQDIAMAGDDQPTNPNPNPNLNANAPPPGAGFARTLDGSYVPSSSAAASSSASSSRRQPAQRGLRTLGDLQNQGPAGHAGHGHAHDDDDDDDDQDNSQDFFAGGEKSGLAVQNPNHTDTRRQINSILKRARQDAARPGGDDDRPAPTFRGTGMTLGGDDTPSRAVPDPNADVAPRAPRAHRELHLWRDGFSVDDGDLYKYDDPANARTLDMIHSGHAPLHILNVEHGQEVDVEVHQHPDEDYVKPKKKYTPFGGSGHRLGSPTPGATSFSAPPPAPAASSSSTAAPASTSTPSVEVDSAAPTLNLQIRLGDGTRLQSRFNTTHTVGDVYDFVNAASPTSTQREYALMTTFPSKELNDKSQALGDLSEFKRGGVVVQKWK